jgi:hypothetical protein
VQAPTLPKPTSAEHAFDTIPATSTGQARVRRFADDNVNAWNMVLDLARSATKTMHFSFYTIEKDPYGWSFLGAALYNQLRGVQVTGMTDWSSNSRGRGFASIGLGSDYLQELANAGATMAVFNTPGSRVAHLLQHGPSYGAIGCNHDKMLVVDAGTDRAQGETGGRNIAGPYHQDAADNPASWRDDTIHIVGKDATAGFVTSIERELDGGAAKVLKPDIVNFANRSRELLFAYALMEEWVSGKAFTDDEKKKLRESAGARSRAEVRLEKMIASLPAESRKTIPASITLAELGTLQELADALVKDVSLAGSRAAYEKLGGFVDAEVKIVDQVGAASAAPGQRYNADLLSGRVNGEIGAITKSKESAAHLTNAITADLANPANGFSEWTIRKDANGKAVLDGKGRPIVVHGPAHDVKPRTLRMYGPMQTLCRILASSNDDLAHPPLSDALRADN